MKKSLLFSESKFRWILLIVFMVSAFTSTAQQCLPTFTNAAPDITVSCTEPLPAFEECEATSDCCSDVEVSTFISETGALLQSCEITTAVGPGPDWAFWLPGLYPGNDNWHFVDGGQFEAYGDGTARIWGVIRSSADPSLQFEANIWLTAGRNWSQWSALGRGYKDDFNLASTLHQDWMYYEIAEGFAYLEGIGSLSGSHIQLSHKPSNYYFGFQSGVAANNKNGNNGISGWFYYNGMYNGTAVSGHGDVNVDSNCSEINANCTVAGFTHVCRAEGCGAVVYRDQTIHSVDTQSPQVIGESSITVACGEEQGVFIQASDICSDVSITFLDEVLSPGCSGQLLREYTVSDACGNITLFSQLIQLSGGQPVFITFPDDTAVECSSIPDPLQSGVTYADGCSNTQLTVSSEVIPGSCLGAYTLVYTYTLTDDCGNIVTRTWEVSVTDQTAPTLYGIPQNTTLNCGDAIQDVFVFAIDDCGGEASVALTATTVPTDCGYQFIRTWTAIDDCGNSTSAEQVITVSDNQQPIFTFVPSDITAACDASSNEVIMATAEDECSSVVVTYSDEIVTTDCGSITYRTFTATDGCGNAASTTQVITNVDTTAPEFTVFPEDLVVSCIDAPNPAFVPVDAFDLCSETTITWADEIIAGECANSYTILRHYSAADACGNVSTLTQTIIIFDNTAPAFEYVPADYTINCDEPLIFEDPIVYDDCAETFIDYSEQTTDNSCGYSLVRTWTAYDGCNNTNVQSQTITVVDTTAPQFENYPSFINVNCNEDWNIPSPIAADNCSSVEITYNDVAIESGCAGGIERTYTATDNCGNTANLLLLIFINDTIAPQVISFPENLTLACGDDIPTAESGIIEVIENCSSYTTDMFESIFNGTCIGSQIIRRTYFFIDLCGNITARTWEINIIDSEGPVFDGVPASLTIECGDLIPEPTTPNVFDACGLVQDVFFTETIEEGDCSYTINRTWLALDVCGNATEATQVITVEDTRGPVFSDLPEDFTVSCNQDVPAPVLPTAYDVCAQEFFPVFLAENILPGDCGNDYTIQRVFRSFDNCGNSTLAVQNVYVIDNVAPIITGETTLALNCGETDGIFIEATDACNSVQAITYVDESAPGTNCANDIVRHYQATDICGNIAEFTQVISIVDAIAPAFVNFPEDALLSCNQIPNASEAGVTFSDNCSSVILTYEDNIIFGLCPNEYILERTYHITDNCGNTTSRTWTVQVSDNEAPVIYGVPQDITLECGTPISESLVFGLDNCSAFADIIVSAETTPLDCGYLFTRTWLAVDECGNTSSASQTITFEDNSAPVLSGDPQDIVLTCGDALPPLELITAYDECAGDVAVDYQESTTGSGCDEVITRTWCAYDCNGTSTCVSQVISFVQNDQLIFAIQSQNSQSITLRFATTEDEHVSMEILDSNGQLVDRLYNSHAAANETYTVDVDKNQLASGVYMIRLLTNSGQALQRVVIAH
ncbi:MAG: T9SS type A sorting domain-containing protein [Flavobacteriales bacterium]